MEPLPRPGICDLPVGSSTHMSWVVVGSHSTPGPCNMRLRWLEQYRTQYYASIRPNIAVNADFVGLCISLAYLVQTPLLLIIPMAPCIAQH